MRTPARRLAALAACAALALPAGAQRIRGITVSSHGGGRDWASDAIVPTFMSLQELGANWVTIHPWGRIHADGAVTYRPLSAGSAAGDGIATTPVTAPLAADSAGPVTRPIAEAHRLGLKILIKPQIAYWGSPFSWPGEVEFSTPEAWERFFSSYEAWLLDVAAAARDADALAIGTELDRTLDGAHAERWRALIRRVRAVFPGALTYAANWTDYRRVPFWDALDAIGVQAYFPLADRQGASEDQLRARWSEIMAELRAFAEVRDQYVVFTELGYNRSLDAPLRPWEARTDDIEQAEAVQQTCMRVALEAIEHEPRVIGAFLWKWFPEPHPEGRDFQLASRGMRRVIAEVWHRYGGEETP